MKSKAPPIIPIPQPKSDAEMAAYQLREKQAIAITLLKSAGIPPLFQSSKKEFCCVHPGWRKSFTHLCTILTTRNHGHIVVLCGGRGTGKTRMAIETLRHLVATQLFAGSYSTLEDYLRSVKGNDPDWNAVDDRYHVPRILVLDEVAKSGDSAWVEAQLFHLVNKRFADLKHTILLCASNPSEVNAILGPSILDRVQEYGALVHLPWKSFRPKTAS